MVMSKVVWGWSSWWGFRRPWAPRRTSSRREMCRSCHIYSYTLQYLVSAVYLHKHLKMIQTASHKILTPRQGKKSYGIQATSTGTSSTCKRCLFSTKTRGYERNADVMRWTCQDPRSRPTKSDYKLIFPIFQREPNSESIQPNNVPDVVSYPGFTYDLKV